MTCISISTRRNAPLREGSAFEGPILPSPRQRLGWVGSVSSYRSLSDERSLEGGNLRVQSFIPLSNVERANTGSPHPIMRHTPHHYNHPHPPPTRALTPAPLPPQTRKGPGNAFAAQDWTRVYPISTSFCPFWLIFFLHFFPLDQVWAPCDRDGRLSPAVI